MDSDEEDTDSDDDSSSDDDLESVSLVPEDSNALDASVSARRGARDDDDDETADDADGGVTASAGATPCTSAVARAAFSGVGEEVTSPGGGGGAAQSLKRPHSGARDDSDGETSDTGMIAKRTRAHVNLHDVDVDYLEKMMPLPADEDAYQARSIHWFPYDPVRRGERRSLRTFAGASLRPPLAFNPRPRRLSTPTDAFELHPDVALYGTALSFSTTTRSTRTF